MFVLRVRVSEKGVGVRSANVRLGSIMVLQASGFAVAVLGGRYRWLIGG